MFTSLNVFVLVAVCALSVNAQRQFGTNCRNVNCASGQQCLGLYESCKGDLVDGSTCGFYATCVDLNGEVKHSERPASTSSVGDEPKPVQRDSTRVNSSNATNVGQLYPNLPLPDNPPSPQGGYYPPNPQGGYYPPNPQGGYYAPNPQGGYYPPNPQGAYYPTPPPSSGNKKDSSSDSGFGSLLNFFGSGNRGSSSGSSGGPDLGSLLSILGKGNSGNTPSSSGSGGLDFSSLLSAFTGTGGSGQNTRNNFDNRNPTGPVPQNPNPSYGGNNVPNPNQPQDNGPSFLQTLGNFATSPLGQQLLVNALRNRGENENDAQQSRRFGGLFSENTGRTTQSEPGSGTKGYPTQPPNTM